MSLLSEYLSDNIDQSLLAIRLLCNTQNLFVGSCRSAISNRSLPESILSVTCFYIAIMWRIEYYPTGEHIWLDILWFEWTKFLFALYLITLSSFGKA